jgi:hypothetical protein
MSVSASAPRSSTAQTWSRIGLFALPVYGVLLATATMRPQPNQAHDPEGWAQFVTAPTYLVEHVLSGIVGAVLVILGTVALGAFLAAGKAARLALTGMVLAVVGQILLMVPGVISTVATPAIGAAYLKGNTDAMTLEFPPTLAVAFGIALLLTVAGNVTLGVATWRSRVLPRWAGVVWAVAAVIFYLAGAALGMATTGASLPTQPVGALLMAVSGAAFVWAGSRRSQAAPTAHLPASVVVDRG